MLTVYKASAGSGKTFQLVVEYLKLLLKNPSNYKHILAVTFTNKATNEMKTRILEQLHLLADNKTSHYLDALIDNHLTEEYIRSNAKQVLKNILHDYNRFSINTIDSFTQRVIKSFNRELGISPNFTVELDSEMILDEAIDRMLSKIDQNKNLLKWLKEFSKEKIEGNYSQRIDDDIKSLGKELFKEKFQLFFPRESESVYNRQNLDSLGKELNKIKTSFENRLKDKGKMALMLISNHGLSIDDFSNKISGIAGFFKHISEGSFLDSSGKLRVEGSRVRSALYEVEKWYTKNHQRRDEIHQLTENELQPLLKEIAELFEKESQRYYTAVIVLKQLRILGILSDLKEEVKILLHEKSTLQISDFNILLSRIIGNSDTPFIYEKTGNYYKHFMLDEFQDTSALQWNNFKPLVLNSLAEGHNNLVVGDVKQSIYRWRNSDWKILADQLNKDFVKNQLKEYSLDKNWRSNKNIIDFNNAIFKNLKENFENALIKELDSGETFIEKFRNIYETIKQKPGQDKDVSTGYINVQFLPEEEFVKDSTHSLVDQVKRLQDKGIKAAETAILIRKNSEGQLIIEEFLKASKKDENRNYNLSVLSNESLFLHASKGVLLVIHTIEHIIDSDNEITKVALFYLWVSWLKPELQKRGKYESVNKNQFQIEFSNALPVQLDETFLDYFESEIGTYIKSIRDKILLSSPDETVTHICSQFSLFDFESELPFLQTLIDKTGELKTSISNDLSNLLFWWNEKGYRTSVNVNEEVDSIRLLTVHKSKGLEFKAVLIPYLNWGTSWSGRNAPILWCEPKTKPFNQFPLLPVMAGGQMEKSDFKDIFYEEKVNYIIDSLNLVYVAFTRAKSVLIINAPLPGDKNRKQGKSIHHLLLKSLNELNETNQFSGSFNTDIQSFTYGKIPFSEILKEETKSVIIGRYHFKDFKDRLQLRSSGDDFLIPDTNKISIKNKGKIIHEILSEIETVNDLERALVNALKEGRIDKDEMNNIQGTLKERLGKPEIRSWFDGSYQILNERSLLTKDRIFRPDRIMFAENETIVVDYKTGEKKSENYNRQVKRYANVLKDTGRKKVTGYLWYISRDEVEKVCEL